MTIQWRFFPFISTVLLLAVKVKYLIWSFFEALWSPLSREGSAQRD